MNRIKNIVFLFITVMFVSIINVDAASVSIKSVKLVDKTESVTELSEAKVDGFYINFDLEFSKLGDNAKYEVILNNPTNHEYEINTEKTFGPSNYISYSYELKDKTNRIKAKSEAVVYVTISYDNPVPSDKLVNGKYIENNDMGIALLNETNPNTINNILFIIIMIFMMIGATLIFRFTKDKGLYIIVLSLLLVPITVFALEKLRLTFSTKVTIDERYNVFYLYNNFIKTSEVDNNKSIYSCDKNIYRVNNGDNTFEEYKWCGLIDKDPNSYKENTSVNIYNHTFYGKNTDYCSNEGNNTYTCEYDPVMTSSAIFLYTCGNKSNYKSFEEFIEYSQAEEGPFFYLNVCDKEEFYNTFNLASDEKMWYDDLDYGDVTIWSGNQFIMPRHDVYIYLSPDTDA